MGAAVDHLLRAQGSETLPSRIGSHDNRIALGEIRTKGATALLAFLVAREKFERSLNFTFR
jgi:hypothetical protein